MTISRETPLLTKEEQAAWDLFKSGKALAKVIPDWRYDFEAKKPVLDFTDIDFYLDQILDPKNKRPSRIIHFYKQEKKAVPPIVKKIDLRDLKIHDHHPAQCRFKKHKDKDYQHTPKTSTSLLPTSPEYMHVFDDDAVGYVWNIDTCNLKKEKYVFPKNAGTSRCFWFSEDVEEIKAALRDRDDCQVTSVAKLREKNDKAAAEKKAIKWNELLVGLPKGRQLAAMFAPSDDLAMRLRTLHAMQHTKEKLGYETDIPLFIIQSGIDSEEDPENPEHRKPVFRLYTAAEREADIEAARKMDHPLIAKFGLFATSVAAYEQETPLHTSIKQGFIGF